MCCAAKREDSSDSSGADTTSARLLSALLVEMDGLELASGTHAPWKGLIDTCEHSLHIGTPTSRHIQQRLQQASMHKHG